MSLYCAENLSVSINGTQLVKGLSFSIDPGACLALVGESGSGKSLTCLAPFGLSGPQASGSVRFDGTEICGLDERDLRSIRAQRAGFVFQQPLSALTPHLKIGAQLTEAFCQAGAAKPDRRVLKEQLARVGLADGDAILDQYPHRLSGGQRQRVMISAAIAHRPKLLVADEPTTALDASLRRGILDLLDALRREEGLAVLLVSHDLASVRDHADHVVVMRDGEAVEQGAVQTLLQAPRAAYTRELIAASLTLDTPRPALATPGAPLLVAEQIKVSFPRPGWTRGRIKAVDGVDLIIHEGESVALVGESGSGKSTLGRAIARLGPCDAGRVVSAGAELPPTAAMKSAQRRTIQPVFQDPQASLDPLWRVRDSIAEPLKYLSPELDAEPLVRAALAAVDLPESFLDRLPRSLSGGQAQRVAIARALVSEPKMLLLDEATSALDALVASQVLGLLQKLQRERKLAMLVITHDLALARQLCHRIVVLEQGRVVEHGVSDAVITAPAHPVTQRLVEASR